MLLSAVSYAQPVSRIVYSSKYIKAPGFIADSNFKPPSDTTNYKTGFAIIGSTMYAGNGVKWTAPSGGGGGATWGTITGDLDTQSDLFTALGLKVNTGDTAAMLAPYLRESDTASLSGRINLKVNISDTANMLNPYLRKTDTATLSNRINLKLNISDTAAMMKRDTTSCYLLADTTTSSTSAVGTPLRFQIAANARYVVEVNGTASKASSTTGLKLAIGAPASCTIKGYQQSGAAAVTTAMTNSLLTAINSLGSTFATGTGVEVPFRMVFTVTNGANAGVIQLQFATVTSNVARIYAGTNMRWTRTKGL